MGGNQIGGATNRRVGWSGRFGGAGALLLSALLAAPASAQTAFDIPMDFGKASAFTLSGIGDFGRIGMRTSGAFMPGCISNESGMHAPRNAACTTAPLLFNSARGLTEFLAFEAPFFILAPPGDLPEGIDPASLPGQGWTAHTRAVLPIDQVELRASDRSGRDLLNLGIVSTADGSCRDFRGQTDGRIPAGTQLLPHTNCRDTWPAAASSWEGMKRITLENFLAAQSIINPTGDGDPFAFWSVPEELTTGEPLGNQATYGEFVDWSVDQMPNYPAAIPGGGGGGRAVGSWPTGLTVRFDGFYFGLPGVNNAYFIQYTIINDSEQVYGTGIDFDSLYVGTIFLEGNNSQQQSFFVDIPRGGLYIRNCDNNPPNGTPTPYGASPDNCVGAGFGWGAGAQGMMVLKSPIGDLRNKHLTDPTHPFFNPAHPNVGDTITYNHRHGCGFITCTDHTMSFSERATFGLFSSTLDNVLDGRDRNAAFTDANYWNMVYPTEVWPTRGDFNKYVPGVHDSNPIWDYNHDGVPDTLYFDNCGSKGCVPLWEDTLPGGWQNRQGQTAPLTVGPFPLAAGDTTGLLVAMIADRDSASFESTIQNIYDLYQSFFLVPEAAPPSDIRLTTAGVTGGERNDAEVRLNLDESTASFVDQFLLQLATNIEEAEPATEFGKLRVLNPGLVEQIRERAADNVVAVHIFKSCDGGTTFTDDGDCFPDPVNANDVSSKWNGFGFLPWQTATPTTSVVIDNQVTAGITYLYSIVTETRGLTVNVLQDTGEGEVPTDGEGNPICDPTRCGPVEIPFAPVLLSPLNKTPDARGVLSVYVPLSRPAGTIAESIAVQSDVGEALVPVTFSMTEGLRSGSFSAVFSEEFEVTQEITTTPGEGGAIDTVSVSATVVSAEGTTYTGTAPVSLRSATVVEDEEFPAPGDPDATVHRTVHTVAGSPAMLLIDNQLQPAAGPIMATAELAEGSTTPGTFLNNPRFPGFFIDVDAGQGGEHGSEVFFTPAGDSVRNNISANTTVEWLEGDADDLAGIFGQYVIDWADRPYGPGEIFTVSPGIEERFAQSLSARQTASSSVTSAEAEAAIEAALSTEEEPADVTLAAVSLPFTITNATDNRPVQVAVISHGETVFFGFGSDTATLDVPGDRWIPGDRLVLLEQVDGVLTPTWEVTLGCSAASGLREACSATTGGTSNTYAPIVFAGVQQVVTYFRPLSPELTFTVTSTARRMDPAAVAQQLEEIRVVPNPYVMFSEFERNQNTRILKWTHMPPEGTLRIFTLTGHFVQQIDWTEGDLTTTGDLNWNMRTRENTELAYGLYLWVLESPAGEARGKFVVIR